MAPLPVYAMQRGVDVIYQASLVGDQWWGLADFLMKVDRPSLLGAWSYEVRIQAVQDDQGIRAVLQLCLYTELVAAIQGTLPERMLVVKPRQKDSTGTFEIDVLKSTTSWPISAWPRNRSKPSWLYRPI